MTTDVPRGSLMRLINKPPSALWILIALVLAGVIMVANMLIRQPAISGDSLFYLFPIHNLLDGQGYAYRGIPELVYPPGVGLLSYVLFGIAGDVARSGALLSALCYVMLIPATYYSARLLFGVRAAVLAAFFITFSPWLLQQSFAGLSDVPFTLFYLLSFTAYARLLLNGNSFLQSALLGLLLACSYLIRPEAFLPAVLVTASLFGLLFVRIVARHFNSDTPRIRMAEVSYPLVTVIAFTAISLPYLLFLHKHTGRWTISTKTMINVVIGERVVDGSNRTVLPSADDPDYWRPSYILPVQRVSLVEYIKSRDKKFLLRILLNLVDQAKFMALVMFHAIVPLVILLLLALLHSDRKRLLRLSIDSRGKKVALAFVVFLTPLLALLVFYIRIRYLLPYAALIQILLASYIVHLLTSNRRITDKGWLRHAMVATMAVSFFSLSGVLTSRSSLYATVTSGPSAGMASVRAAGIWLYEHESRANDISIVGLGPGCGELILFFAGGRQMPRGRFIPITPDMTMEDTANLLHTGEAKYLVLTKSCGHAYPEAVQQLWEHPSQAEDYGLSLVQDDSNGLFQVYSSTRPLAVTPLESDRIIESEE